MTRFLLFLLLALGAGALIALASDLAIPVVILLLPGLVTLLLDRSAGLTLARAVLVFQAIAAVGPVHQAYYACSGLHACLTQVCRPMTVVTVWLAAAGAWALSEMVPIGLHMLDDVRLRARRAELLRQRTTLVAEWGLSEPAAAQAGRRR
jgi:hypothetical protein